MVNLNLVDWEEVNMGEFKKAGRGISQYSENFLPCLGIGFYNSKSDESYMAHYSDLIFYDIEKDFEKVRRDLGNSNLTVFCMGGALDKSESFEYNQAIIQDRRKIENLVREKFSKSEIIFNWNNSEKFVDFYLDKNKKSFYVK